MIKVLQGFWNKRRYRIESGYTVTFQAIYYTVLLFMLFALIFDMGNVAFVFTIASNSARLAAQDAAKNIDQNIFINDQQIRLDPDEFARAQEMVNGMTDGKVAVTYVGVTSLPTRDVITVKVSATADMPVLGSLFGLHSVTIPLDAYAEPAYGISAEGQ